MSAKPHWLRSVLKKVKKRGKQRRRRSPFIEPLERREMLYAGLQNLSLYNDTDMPGDLITSDPTVTGTVSGDFMYGAGVEFDHHGDGMAEGSYSVYTTGEQFTYDPRNNDPSLSSYSGVFPLKVRAVEYDEYYMPMTPGNWEDFTFTIDASGGSGSGSNAEIELYDSMYYSIPDGMGQFDFGSTYVGSPLSQTFTIQNDGMDDLTLDAGSLMLPSGFSLVSGFSETVSPYSQTYFTVQLDATAGGNYQGEISFANNDTDENPYNFYVTGDVSSNGSNADIELYDSMYFSIPDGTGQFNFGSTYVGSPLSQTFTIQNDGMDDLTLDASSLTLPSGFSLVSGFSETVSPYSQTYFTVQLDATAGGNYQGEISFANNDTDENPYNFYVTGDVSSSGSNAEIELYDSMYYSIPDGMGQFDFGSTYVGSPLSQTFTIQNDGTSNLTLDAGSLMLPSGFSLVSGFSETVSPYSQTYFTVQLEATAGGSYQGEISFANNDTDENPYSFHITGVVDGGGGAGADVPGDDLSTGHIVTLAAGVSQTFSEEIGDGLYGDQDVDLYKVTLTAGQTLHVDVDAEYFDDGSMLSSLDSYIRVFNANAEELSANSSGLAPGDYGSGLDPYVAFSVPSSGTYYIGVSGSANEDYDPAMLGTGMMGSVGLYELRLLLDSPPPPFPTLSIADLSVNEGVGTALLTVTLSAASGEVITVDYVSNGGTAGEGVDYTPVSGSLTFNPGEMSKTIGVNITDDTIDEPNEQFVVVLGSVSNSASIADSDATVTIVDNDEPTPTLSFSSTTVTVNEDAATAIFTVVLSSAQGAAVTVDYTTSGISATVESDYIAADGTLMFNPGETSKNISVDISDDAEVEGNEEFRVILSSVSNNATIATSEATGIIVSDDVPTISFDDVITSVSESGGSAVLTVTLSAASGSQITVNYATQNVTALAGSDYTSKTGTLTFAANDTSETISIPILNDSNYESDETFRVVLSGATNATIGTSQATITILDNDAPVEDPPGDQFNTAKLLNLSSGSSWTYSEEIGNGLYGDRDIDFYKVTLSAGTRLSVDVDARHLDSDGSQLSELNSYLRIFDANGFKLAANDDGFNTNDYGYFDDGSGEANVAYTEYNETAERDAFISFTAPTAGEYYVGVSANDNIQYWNGDSATSGGIGAYQLEMSVVGAQPSIGVSVSVEDITVNEGSQAVFTVTLSESRTENTELLYRTRNGTATPNADYGPTSGTLVILAGNTSGTVAISTLGDSQWEATETFNLEITGPADVFETATARVLDNAGQQNGGRTYQQDSSGSGSWYSFDRFITIENVEVTEGGQAKFEVKFIGYYWVDPFNGQEFTVSYQTRNRTANAGTDYVSQNGSITFSPGGYDENGDYQSPEYKKVVVIETLADWRAEKDEQFYVDFSTPWGDQPVAVATIREASAPLGVGNAWALEGNSVDFQVRISPQDDPLTINYIASEGSASDGYDVGLTSGTVTIQPGDTLATISFDTYPDHHKEGEESFYVEFWASGGYHTMAQGIILDDQNNIPQVTLNAIPKVIEGDNVTVTISLDRMLDSAVTVYVNTTDGSATGCISSYCEDYEGGYEPVTFQAGETTKTVSIPTFYGWSREGTEHFFVELQTPWGEYDVKTVTITEDSMPDVSVDSQSVPGGQTAVFTANLSYALNTDVTINYYTFGGSAYGSCSDYCDASGSLTFEAGTVSKTFEVDTVAHDYGMPEFDYDEADVHYFVVVETLWQDFFVGQGTVVYDGIASYQTNPLPQLVAADDTFEIRHDLRNGDDGYYYGMYGFYEGYGVTGNDHYANGGGYSPSFLASLAGGGVEHGTLSFFPNGSFKYVPDPGFVGTDTFQYMIWDGVTQSNVATVTLHVTNDVPAAEDDVFHVWHDSFDNWSSFSVLENDDDQDALKAYVDPYNNVEHGTLELFPNGKFVYTPDPGFVGNDTFTYFVTDEVPQTTYSSWSVYGSQPWYMHAHDTATVTIHVDNDAPVAEDDPDLSELDLMNYGEESQYALTVWHDSRQNWSSVNVLWNDHEAEIDYTDYSNMDYYYGYASSGSDTLRAVLVDQPAHGHVELFPNGQFNYTPKPHYVGDDSFTYAATDGASTSLPASVKIKVTNDIPDAHDDPFDGQACPDCIGGVGYSVWTHGATGPEAYYYGGDDADGFYVWNDDQPGSYDLVVDGVGVLHNDADQDFLTAELVSCASYGRVELASDGSFKYYARPGYARDDSFAYRVTDGVVTQTKTVRLSVHRAGDDTYDDRYFYFQEAVPSEQWLGSFGLQSDTTGNWWCTLSQGYEHTGAEPIIGVEVTELLGEESGVDVFEDWRPTEVWSIQPTGYDEYGNWWGENWNGNWYENWYDGYWYGWRGYADEASGQGDYEWDDGTHQWNWVGQEYVSYGSAAFRWDNSDSLWHGDDSALSAGVTWNPATCLDFYSQTVCWGTGWSIDESQFTLIDPEEVPWSLNANGQWYRSTVGDTLLRIQGTRAELYADNRFELDVASDTFAYDDIAFRRLQEGDLGWSEAIEQNTKFTWYTDGGDRFIQYYDAGEGASNSTLAYYDVGFPEVSIDWGDGTSSDISYDVADLTQLFTDWRYGYHDISQLSSWNYNSNYYHAAYPWYDWRGGNNGYYDVFDYHSAELWVQPEHTYSAAGTFPIQVTIFGLDHPLRGEYDDDYYYYGYYYGYAYDWYSNLLYRNFYAQVGNGIITATGQNDLAGDEGTDLHKVVATFTDTNTADPASKYSALIEWGDGRTSAGQVVGSSGNFSVHGSHAFNQDGVYNLRVLIRDKDGGEASTTSSITVGNVLPTAVDDHFDWSHGIPLQGSVVANDQDPGDDVLTAVLLSPPTWGPVVMNADGTFTYTPEKSRLVTDSYTYRVSDEHGEGTVGTVTITTTNDPPVPKPDTGIRISHDRTSVLDITSNDEDPDVTDKLTPIIVTQPVYGTLRTKKDGTVVYTPQPLWLGFDSFSYKLSDGFVEGTEVATVVLEVKNDPPEPEPDAWTMSHDRVLRKNVVDNDIDLDGDKLIVELISGVEEGILDLHADGTFAYAPPIGWVGTVGFSYRVFDGLASAESFVEIMVKNDPPEVDATTNLSVVHDRTLSGNMLDYASDGDNDPLQVVLTSTVSHGSLTVKDDGSFQYIPEPAFEGDDSFTFIVRDGVFSSDEATVNITVTNQIPVANDDLNYKIGHDRVLTVAGSGVIGNDWDTDFDPLTATLITPTFHGHLLFNEDGTFEYSPFEGFFGTDQFVYRISDGIADSVQNATVEIEVTQTRPTANDVNLRQPHDQTMIGSLAASAFDADGDELTWRLESDLAAGTGLLRFHSDGKFAYSPPLAFAGTATFTYSVADILEGSEIKTVTIEVTQDAPQASNDKFNVAHDRILGSVGVMANDHDADTTSTMIEPLTARVVVGVEHGSLAFNSDGKFSYQPDEGYFGDDSFTYVANDGRADSNEATVTIHVLQTAPVSQPDVYTTSHGRTTAKNVLSNDFDGENDILMVELLHPDTLLPVSEEDLNLPGDFELLPNGAFTFIPDGDWADVEIRFAYRASDGIDTGEPQQVSIQYVQSAPIAVPDLNNKVTHDKTLITGVSIACGGFGVFGGGFGFGYSSTCRSNHGLLQNDHDADADPLTAVLFDPSAGDNATVEALGLLGELAWNEDDSGMFTYTPPVAWIGVDEFYYRAFDGWAYSEPALVRIEAVQQGAPEAHDDEFVLIHDRSLSDNVTLNDLDPDKDLMIPSLVDPDSGDVLTPAELGLQGTLTWDSGSFTYTPPEGWWGQETFYYQVSDGLEVSDPAMVTIEVRERAPVAADDNYRVKVNGSLHTPSTKRDYGCGA